MDYKVKTQPAGHEFEVKAGETILDAALRLGLGFPYSCRGGTCGSCKGKVIAGQLDAGVGAETALSTQEREAGMALMCQARPLSDVVIEIREFEPGEVRPRKYPCRVAKLEKLAHDVMRVYLQLPPKERMPFRAGQYIDILLAQGGRRSFSLANAPHDDKTLELHIRHVGGGEFTEHVFERMKEKDMLRIEGPFGQFYWREASNRPVIFMAGGTGFAPIKGVVEHAFAEDVQRPMYFYWGVRALRDLYLDELPRRWAQEHSNFHYIPVLSAPLPEDHWQGRVGFVHQAIADDYADLSGYDVYACGPPIMIQVGREIFLKHGLPAEHFYCDAFEFSPDRLQTKPGGS